jgi:hypothetical protein
MAATDGMLFPMPPSAGQATLTAWHARSGQQAWTRAVPAGAVAQASGSVLYIAAGRTLTAVAATTGGTLWSYRLGADVADVTADGHVVYALDERVVAVRPGPVREDRNDAARLVGRPRTGWAYRSDPQGVHAAVLVQRVHHVTAGGDVGEVRA